MLKKHQRQNVTIFQPSLTGQIHLVCSVMPSRRAGDVQGDVDVYADYSTDDVTRLLKAVARGNKPEIGQEDAMDDTILAHMEHMRFRRALQRRAAFSPRNVALPANTRSHPADFH